MFDYFYKRPYTLYALIAGFFILGIVGLTTLPKNLFPDANPPKSLLLLQFRALPPRWLSIPYRNPLRRKWHALAK